MASLLDRLMSARDMAEFDVILIDWLGCEGFEAMPPFQRKRVADLVYVLSKQIGYCQGALTNNEKIMALEFFSFGFEALLRKHSTPSRPAYWSASTGRTGNWHRPSSSYSSVGDGPFGGSSYGYGQEWYEVFEQETARRMRNENAYAWQRAASEARSQQRTEKHPLKVSICVTILCLHAGQAHEVDVVLGDQSQFKKIYREAVKRTHPDTSGGETRKEFEAVQNASATIKQYKGWK
jgi:hypothetical protein